MFTASPPVQGTSVLARVYQGSAALVFIDEPSEHIDALDRSCVDREFCSGATEPRAEWEGGEIVVGPVCHAPPSGDGCDQESLPHSVRTLRTQALRNTVLRRSPTGVFNNCTPSALNAVVEAAPPTFIPIAQRGT